MADYLPAVEGLDHGIDRIEASVFHRPGRSFRVRRSLLRLRQTLASLREVMRTLAVVTVLFWLCLGLVAGTPLGMWWWMLRATAAGDEGEGAAPRPRPGPPTSGR